MFFILASRHTRPGASADDDQRLAAAAAYLVPECSLPSGTIIITFRDPKAPDDPTRRDHPTTARTWVGLGKALPPFDALPLSYGVATAGSRTRDLRIH
jgi:hypothetical protein